MSDPLVEKLTTSWRETDRQAAERIRELEQLNEFLQRTLLLAILSSNGKRITIPDTLLAEIDPKDFSILQSYLRNESVTVLTAGSS